MADSDTDGLTVAVEGAGGYVGGELLGILARHPRIARVIACSKSRAGKPVSASHPRLLGKVSTSFAASAQEAGVVDVVFFATPPRVAMGQARGFLDAGATVVDCSPDFRIKDIAQWEDNYGEGHAAPDLVATAAYGLVELNRKELQGARLIAAPGCYATIVQLAAAPVVRALAKSGCEDVLVIADCASGTSGAGRRADRPELLLSEAGGNFSAYALDGHRHLPEMVGGIGAHAGLEPRLRFVPHLLPIPRGMFATLHFIPDRKADIDLGAALADAYGDESFVRVLDGGKSPQVAAVVNTNMCHIGHAKSSLTVLAALDNLGKGAAGQAVQALNAARGLGETEGLDG